MSKKHLSPEKIRSSYVPSHFGKITRLPKSNGFHPWFLGIALQWIRICRWPFVGASDYPNLIVGPC